MGRSNYAEKVARMLGWQRVGYQPETRYWTSGTKSWKTEKVFSGPLDRMWSGWQKVSAWEGISARSVIRSTGIVMTGVETPTPNQMVTFRTQRALKSQTPQTWGQYGPTGYGGPAEADMYYAEVAAQSNRPQMSTARRLLGLMRG